MDERAPADTVRVVTDERSVVDIAGEVPAASGWANSRQVPAGSGTVSVRYSSAISFGPNGHTFSKRAQTRNATQPRASQARDHSMGWRPGEFLSA